jgi:hypothetical protein
MECENCHKEHDGSYGSGRFCSDHCRRAYSGKRVNVNGKHKCNFKRKSLPYGTWKCKFCCDTVFNTKHELYEHYHLKHLAELKRKSWNKGKTKDTDIRLKNAGEKMHNKYISNELIPSFTGRHHSEETKQKMSKSALNSKH